MAECKYCHEDLEGYVKPLEKNCHAYMKHMPEEMVIVHKISGQILTMQRGGMDRGDW